MTDDERKAIRERWAKATPGPWSTGSHCPPDEGPYVYAECYTRGDAGIDGPEGNDPTVATTRVHVPYPDAPNGMGVSYEEARHNAFAIAAAPTDIAALLAEVERLRQVEEAAEQLLATIARKIQVPALARDSS